VKKIDFGTVNQNNIYACRREPGKISSPMTMITTEMYGETNRAISTIEKGFVFRLIRTAQLMAIDAITVPVDTIMFR